MQHQQAHLALQQAAVQPNFFIFFLIMKIRKPLIAGNWKMNLDIKGSISLISELKEKIKGIEDRDILVCPSFISLKKVSSLIKSSNIKLGAQNVCYEDKGAFTGEISAGMLKEAGCKYVIIGHSERRHIFKEDDSMINKKVKNAIKNKLRPILCVGETLNERESNKTKEVVVSQVKNCLEGLSKDDVDHLVIAYEPVWAIGTGKNASPEQAQEVHVLIRDLIKELFGSKISSEIRILYGGSVNPDNMKDLMMQSDIDGALVGGASLKAEDFCKIIKY
jgi:triosephosphate isomerase